MRAAWFLKAGLETEILLAYRSSKALRAAGVTCSNAHRLAAALAIEVVCRAWNAVYRAEGVKPTIDSAIYTFRQPLVRMIPSDREGFPLFKGEHIPAVVDAIQTFPDFDVGDIRGRTDWGEGQGEGMGRASAKPKRGNGNGGKKSRKGVGGRKPLRTAEVQRRKRIVEKWQEAKGAGTRQKDFCYDNGLRVPELERIVAWAAQIIRRNRL